MQNSMRCIIMHLKANIATGSWLKPAERRLSGLDPEPDLDNANVGRDTGMGLGTPLAFPFFAGRSALRRIGEARGPPRAKPCEAGRLYALASIRWEGV